MSTLLKSPYFIRRHILMLMGLCLCLYFSYHAIQGQRSVLTLWSLETQIETLSAQYADLQVEKAALARKVALMRPGAVDKDMLEEQARLVLGYRAPDEFAVLARQASLRPQ